MNSNDNITLSKFIQRKKTIYFKTLNSCY